MRGIKKGFTLIELMVVIAIIAILVVIAIPSYNSYSNDQKLNEAVSQLQTILRQAQNNAQTGTICKIGSNTYTASSWIVILNSDQYSFTPACSGAPLTPTPSSQQYPLPSGVIISSVRIVNLPNFSDINACTVAPSASPDSSTAIVYKNLSSEIEFNVGGVGCPDGVSNPNVAVVITLSLNSSSTNTQDVVVEKGGPIYVGSAVPTPCPGGLCGGGGTPVPSPTLPACIPPDQMCQVGGGTPCCTGTCPTPGPVNICPHI